MTLHMRTALRMCSFLIYFKAFPANLFKSINLVFCGFSEKGIWERREETVEVLSSQDFPCIRWRGGVVMLSFFLFFLIALIEKLYWKAGKTTKIRMKQKIKKVQT